MIYDSGDYPECQRRALDAARLDGFPGAAGGRAARRPLYRLGLRNYVEATGRGPFESATLRIGAVGHDRRHDRRHRARTGHQDDAGADRRRRSRPFRRTVSGDRRRHAGIALGLGAFASRQAVTAGNAVHHAAIEVREKAIAAASEMLEASAEELELTDGTVQRQRRAADAQDAGAIARAIGGVPGIALPNGVTPGLSSSVDFPPPALTYNNGTHVCEVEVDLETGAVRLITLCRGARQRAHHQSDDRRRPGAWARWRTASARRSTNGCSTTPTASR